MFGRGFVLTLKSVWIFFGLIYALPLIGGAGYRPFVGWIILASVPAFWIPEVIALCKRMLVSVTALAFIQRIDAKKLLLCTVGIILLIFAAQYFRYEIRALSNGVVVKSDRITGKIEWCYPGRGCK